MNSIVRFVIVVLTVIFAAASAEAQTIKPRGSKTAVTAPSTVTPDAPETAKGTAEMEDPSTAPATEPVVGAASIDARLKSIESKMGTLPDRTDLGLVGNELKKSLTTTTAVLNEGQASQLRTSAVLSLFNTVLLVVILGLGGWRMWKDRQARKAYVLVLFAIGLGFAADAQAQTAKPAPTCTIRSISLPDSTGVLVKEQDPVRVIITTRNCVDVKSVEAMADANTVSADITFTVDSATVTRVTTKAEATGMAPTGPLAIKLTLGDGTEVTSSDNVFLVVLDTQVAWARRDARTSNSQALQQTVAVTNKTVEGLRAEVNTAATRVARAEETLLTRPTLDQMKALLSGALGPMQKELADLNVLALALKSDVNLLTRLADELALQQVSLANTEVKKGLFGKKKPFNMEVAAAAERIRMNLATAVQTPQ